MEKNSCYFTYTSLQNVGNNWIYWWQEGRPGHYWKSALRTVCDLTMLSSSLKMSMN
jgi:hypothetical protein